MFSDPGQIRFGNKDERLEKLKEFDPFYDASQMDVWVLVQAYRVNQVIKSPE